MQECIAQLRVKIPSDVGLTIVILISQIDVAAIVMLHTCTITYGFTDWYEMFTAL